mgnify:CR=1 FL=1
MDLFSVFISKQFSSCKFGVVFDWDCTITTQHQYKSIHCNGLSKKKIASFKKNETEYSEEGIKYFLGDDERIDKLRNLFQEIHKKGGCLIINSYGTLKDILELLESADLLEYFSAIYATRSSDDRSSVSWNKKDGELGICAYQMKKVEWLREVLNKFSRPIFFVDDTPIDDEIREQLQREKPFFNFRLGLTKDGNGLTKSMINTFWDGICDQMKFENVDDKGTTEKKEYGDIPTEAEAKVEKEVEAKTTE